MRAKETVEELDGWIDKQTYQIRLSRVDQKPSTSFFFSPLRFIIPFGKPGLGVDIACVVVGQRINVVEAASHFPPFECNSQKKAKKNLSFCLEIASIFVSIPSIRVFHSFSPPTLFCSLRFALLVCGYLWVRTKKGQKDPNHFLISIDWRSIWRCVPVFLLPTNYPGFL